MSQYNILLVEDNKINQIIILNMLKTHNVDVANNGEEGVQLHSENKYDFIIMDIMMPVMDGYDATNIIRNADENSEVPIIAVTANVHDNDQNRCMAAKMNGYLSKPFPFESLKDALSNLGFDI